MSAKNKEKKSRIETIASNTFTRYEKVTAIKFLGKDSGKVTFVDIQVLSLKLPK